MRLSAVRKWGFGELTCPSCGIVLLYSGKSARSKRKSGVGLRPTASTKQAVLHWEPISERILATRFRSMMKDILIVKCYARTKTSAAVEKEAFFEQLIAVQEKFLSILTGVMNTKALARARDEEGRSWRR